MTNSTIFDLPKLLFVPGYKLVYSDVAAQQEYEVADLTYSPGFSREQPALIIWTPSDGCPHLRHYIPINTPTIWGEKSVLVEDIGAFHLAPIEPPSMPNLLLINNTEG